MATPTGTPQQLFLLPRGLFKMWSQEREKVWQLVGEAAAPPPAELLWFPPAEQSVSEEEAKLGCSAPLHPHPRLSFPRPPACRPSGTPAGLSPRLLSAVGRRSGTFAVCVVVLVCFVGGTSQRSVCLSDCVLGPIQDNGTACRDGSTEGQYLLTGHHRGFSFLVHLTATSLQGRGTGWRAQVHAAAPPPQFLWTSLPAGSQTVSH